MAFSGEVAPSARGMASEHLWLAPTSEIHGLTLRRSAHALRVLDDGLPGWLGQGLELNASGLVRVGWRSSSVRLALSEVVVFAPIQRFPAYVEPRSRETFFVVRNVVSAVRAGTSELEFVADTLYWPEALALSQLMNGLLHQLRTTSPYR
ncbi:MAG: hypothetical protein SFX73_10555 [Kofleriaceae bacterium]|nr:hypothetical protein [Kofleriaceae bacterium]